MGTKILDQLNPQQREAVKTIEGPLLVLAGAGTGKTRVITYRMAYMLQNGIKPENILGVTFTNKAAREMKERLAALVSEDVAKKTTLGTFHSLCARILRREIVKLGFTPNFTIADDSDQKGILRQAMGELGYSKDDTPVEGVMSFVGSCKNKMRGPKEAKNFAETDHEYKAAAVYERYQQILENQNMLDFDDMLFLTVKILEDFPELLKKYRDMYKYILVDEYQDTNEVQFELLKLLTGDSHNICVVGDDDQSIYGWRGAVVEHILDFPYHFKNAVVVKLEENYRSTNKILGAANKVISGNSGRYDKELWSEQGEGENIKLIKTETAEDEADFVAEAIMDVVGNERDVEYKDVAVLYRSNHLSRLLEQSLRRFEVPYRLVGGQEFFKRKEIKDAAAYLKLVANPKDDQSLLRILGVPPRGIGDKAVKELKQLQSTVFMPMTELLGNDSYLGKISSTASKGSSQLASCIAKYRKIFEEPGDLGNKTKDYLDDAGFLKGLLKIYKNREEAEKRLDNVNEFLNAIYEFEKKFEGTPYLFEFLENYALLDENDKTEEDETNNNTVTLTTVHAAKGLEFPYVFLVGMEHNLFPHERSINEGSLDEELRLFYVAITRAKNNLVMTHSTRRMRNGKFKNVRPSEFLSSLPGENSEWVDKDSFFKPVEKDEVLDSFANIFSMLDDD
jgi:superfamily I DNA/RNA helicase